jgi:hypothetical protein
MRIVLEVEGGEVTFTVRQAGQTTGVTQRTDLTRAGADHGVDAGPAAVTDGPLYQPVVRALRLGAEAGGRARTPAPPSKDLIGTGTSTPPTSRGQGSPRDKRSAGESRAQAGMKAASERGSAPGSRVPRQYRYQPGRRSFNSGGTGRDAGLRRPFTPQRIISSKRRVTHSNGAVEMNLSCSPSWAGSWPARSSACSVPPCACG